MSATESGAGERVVTTLLHSFDRWSGMCRCGDGPFVTAEWAAHYKAQDQPTRSTITREDDDD